MLAALNCGDLDGQALARRKRSILGNMELLMHRCGALNDYLGVLMRTLLPSEPGQKKNRDADAAKQRLDARINRLYKMPVNLIKHDGFGLTWIEMREGDLARSEEHTSELQSLMRSSYAVFCLKKKITNLNQNLKTIKAQ